MSKSVRVIDRRSFDVNPFGNATRTLATDPAAWIETTAMITDLKRNARDPIPEVFIAHLRARLDGTAKMRRGRGRGAAERRYREVIICALFERFEHWLRRRQAHSGLEGWKTIRTADWWQGPPSERAARMVRHRVDRSVTWQAVQNIAYKVRAAQEA